MMEPLDIEKKNWTAWVRVPIMNNNDGTRIPEDRVAQGMKHVARLFSNDGY
jgi:hypothetical protein